MNTNIKILIVGIEKIDKFEISQQIIKLNDNLTIAPKFSTDPQYNNLNNNYIYYLDPETVNLAYKNNSLLFINTQDYKSYGYTFDDFYNHDIIYVDLCDFNDIPDRFFYEFDILVVWVDSSVLRPTKLELYETKYLEDRLQNFKYLYFLNDTAQNIASIIIEYMNNVEKRLELLEENS